jgi:hypothetical protein
MFLALPFGALDTAHASRIVGGIATPTAWKILPHTPCDWLLMDRRRPSSSMVTRCSAFRSCLISAHSKWWPIFKRRRSSSFRSTNARKLQNTWPRIVRSRWWNIGRVSNSDLTSRKTLSTRHNSLYFSATWSAERSVLVFNTHLPSNRASYLILLSSMLALFFSISQVLSKTLVAHQAFRSLLDLFGKRIDNGLPVGSIFSLLARIDANNVTTAVYLDLLYLQWRGFLGSLLSGRTSLYLPGCESTRSLTCLTLRMRAPKM